MAFRLIKTLENGVRIGELITAHGKIETPFFMPVGTVGSVKGVSPKELDELGAQIVLSNTYHLYLRPGEQLIKNLGGLHKFIGWDKPILTDSGGYQVFSLGKNNLKFKVSNLKSNPNDKLLNDQTSLVKITEEGIEFKSFLDGSKHLFTPEKVIQIQLDLGVDILMPLDVCPSGKATKEEIKKACDLTIEWAKRSKKYFEQQVSSIKYQVSSDNIVVGSNNNLTIEQFSNKDAKRPLLHGIVQGGLYEDLRRSCAKELIALDFDGYSVGGLAVDHETRDMWKTVKLMGEILPANKQRYLMGVGTPDDIVQATKLGMDMFDCVLPTRLARHGSVYRRTSKQLSAVGCQYDLINLLNSKYKDDPKVIDENCDCYACRAPLISNVKGEIPIDSEKSEEYRGQKGKGFSRAYISHLLRSNEILGIRLTTLHNLYQYLELMRELHVEGK